MISLISRFSRNLFTLVIASSLSNLSFTQMASAQETCVVKANTLAQAKALYAQQCSLPRVDCDPFDGVWYCASFRITSSIPPALTTTATQTASPTDTPATTPTTSSSSTTTSTTASAQTTSAARPTCQSASSDTNNDGYGWENNTTCLVTENSATTSTDSRASIDSSTSATTVLASPTCRNASSDSDGDGYGWENNATCLVTANSAATSTESVSSAATVSATNPTCRNARSDPDGDGYGWENDTTCIVSSNSSNTSNGTSNSSTALSNNNPAAADITDLILITGQSNALGANTAYNSALDQPDNQVFAFTDNGWRVASLRQVWDLNWHPRTDPNTDPSNNFALHFGKKTVAGDNSRVVGFILATAPGSPISHWNYQSSFYNQMETKVLNAINQLPQVSALDGILWHQGESDGVDQPYYSDALYSLIANLRNEPWVKSDAAFICGETKIASVNRRLNLLNSDADPKTACVRGIDLTTRGDDRHFDAAALRTIGARYANAYLRMNRSTFD